MSNPALPANSSHNTLKPEGWQSFECDAGPVERIEERRLQAAEMD